MNSEERPIDTFYTRTGQLPSHWQSGTFQRKLHIKRSQIIASTSDKTYHGTSILLNHPTCNFTSVSTDLPTRASLNKTVKTCFIDIDTLSITPENTAEGQKTYRIQLKNKENIQNNHKKAKQPTLPERKEHTNGLEHKETLPERNREDILLFMKKKRKERSLNKGKLAKETGNNDQESKKAIAKKPKYDSEELKAYIHSKNNHRAYLQKSQELSETEKRKQIQERLRKLNQFRMAQRPLRNKISSEHAVNSNNVVLNQNSAKEAISLETRILNVLNAAETLFGRVSKMEQKRSQEIVITTNNIEQMKSDVSKEYEATTDIYPLVDDSFSNGQNAGNDAEIVKNENEPTIVETNSYDGKQVAAPRNESSINHSWENSRFSIAGDNLNILATLERLIQGKRINIDKSQKEHEILYTEAPSASVSPPYKKNALDQFFSDNDSEKEMVSEELFKTHNSSDHVKNEETHLIDLKSEQPVKQDEVQGQGKIYSDNEPSYDQNSDKPIQIMKQDSPDGNSIADSSIAENVNVETASIESKSILENSFESEAVERIPTNHTEVSLRSYTPITIASDHSSIRSSLGVSMESIENRNSDVQTSSWPNIPAELTQNQTLPDFTNMGLNMIQAFLSKEKSRRKEYELLLSLREQTIQAHVQAEISWIRQQKKRKEIDIYAAEMEKAIMMKFAAEKAEIQMLKRRLKDDSLKRQKAAMKAQVKYLSREEPELNSDTEKLDVEYEVVQNLFESRRTVSSKSETYTDDFEELSHISESAINSLESSDIKEDLPSESHSVRSSALSGTSTTEDYSLQALNEKILKLKKRTEETRIESKQRKLLVSKNLAKDILHRRNKKIEWEKKLKLEIQQINHVLDQALNTDGSVSSLNFSHFSEEESFLLENVKGDSEEKLVDGDPDEQSKKTADSSFKDKVVESIRPADHNFSDYDMRVNLENVSTTYSDDFSVASDCSDAANVLIRKIRDLQRKVDDARNKSFELRKQKDERKKKLLDALSEKKDDLLQKLETFERESIPSRPLSPTLALEYFNNKYHDVQVNGKTEIRETIPRIVETVPSLPDLAVDRADANTEEPSSMVFPTIKLSNGEQEALSDILAEQIFNEMLIDIVSDYHGLEQNLEAPKTLPIENVKPPIATITKLAKEPKFSSSQPFSLDSEYVGEFLKVLLDMFPSQKSYDEPFALSPNVLKTVDMDMFHRKGVNSLILDAVNEAIYFILSSSENHRQYGKLPEYLDKKLPRRLSNIPPVMLKQKIRNTIKQWLEFSMKPGDVVDNLLADEVKTEEKLWTETAYHEFYLQDKVAGMIWDDIVSEMMCTSLNLEY